MTKTWRQCYEDLLHEYTHILLLLESKRHEDNPGRRRYDGYFKASKEALDRIALSTPKE